MAYRNNAKNPWILLILLIFGGLIGALLGNTFGSSLPILNQGFSNIGLKPTTVDLAVITITFGLTLKVTVASIVGFIIALFVYFRI